MRDPTQVSILKRDGSQVYYSTYTAAKNAASSANRDTIMIWANLKDGTAEQIVLKDKVDIWIAEGVIIDYNSSTSPGPTITDNNVAVECSIYGMGIIKNTYDNSPWYECVKISNSSSKVSIECDYIEGVGGVVINPPFITFYGLSVRIENAAKFHLICNRVSSQKSAAIWVGVNSTVNDVNLQINNVDTGLSNNNNTGSSAVLISGIGFVTIKEILCRNAGHCLSIRGGYITARIEKMTSKMNYSTLTLSTATLQLNQGSHTQKLVLYFDEISCIGGVAIEHNEGTANLIGRKVYSSNSYGLAYGGSNSLGGSLKCDEIVSGSNIAIILANFNNEYLIDANYIEGNYTGSGFSVVILSEGTSTQSPKFTLKNAKIKNKNTSTEAKGIYFENIYPKVTLNNIKIIAGNADNNIIYLSNGTSIDIKNYGLFGNKNIDVDKIILKIGTSSNYLFTESANLT